MSQPTEDTEEGELPLEEKDTPKFLLRCFDCGQLYVPQVHEQHHSIECNHT